MHPEAEGQFQLPVLILLVEGAIIGEPLIVGHGKDLVLIQRLSLIETSEERPPAELQAKVRSELEQSCREWDFLQKEYMVDPLLAAVQLYSARAELTL